MNTTLGNTTGMTYVPKRAVPVHQDAGATTTTGSAAQSRLEDRQPFCKTTTGSTSATSRSTAHSLQHSTSLARPMVPGHATRPHDSHSLPFEFPIQTFRENGPPPTREDPIKCLEKAFNAYGERVRSDLHDMRGLCTRLIVQEKQEAAKWYALCAKVIMERDYARQKANMLTYQRNTAHLASSASSSSSALSAEVQNDASRAPKRGHADDGDELSTLREELKSPPLFRSKSGLAEARPIRPLRLSPVHSPVGSPRHLSMSPPSSSLPTPPFSSTPIDSTRFTSDGRPVKRKKSSEPPTNRRSSLEIGLADRLVLNNKALTSSPPPSTGPTGVKIKQQPRTPSPINFTPTKTVTTTKTGQTRSPPPRAPDAGEFSHVDVMYVPRNNSFVCRACLLNSSSEPKVFPSSASWDELRDHCMQIHPEACADVARLHPAEIFELRRRLSL